MVIKWKNFLNLSAKEKNVISISELSKKLLAEKSVALFCHVRPDGDSIGSALALSLALETLGIRAEVFCDDQIPSRFFFLNAPKKIKKEFCGDYSALVAIDCADVTRLGSFTNIFSQHKNTYNIDHHISNDRYAKYSYVVNSASNCENVYDLICQMNVDITQEIANLLAMGVMTDTGNFRHKNVTAQTLFTAGKLLEKGADLNNIYYHMFSAQTKQRAKLFGVVMSKLRYFIDGRFAVATVTKQDLQNCEAQPDETEGFIDFVMGVIGVEVGACVLEMQKNKYKVSLRSKSADVNAVASTFGGGGHTLASGCQIAGEYEEVVDRIREAVNRELPVL